jgi:cytochrome c
VISKSFFRNIDPECFLALALAVFSLGMIAFLPHSAASGRGQADSGDPQRGEDLFRRRCTSCHKLDAEKEGPRLRGVFGRKSGSIQSFNYSDALKNANIIWNADSLDKWLTDTDKFIPDNDMNLGIKNAQERSDIVAYLKKLSGQ